MPDQATRAATSGFSSVAPATTSGTPARNARVTPPYPPLVTIAAVRGKQPAVGQEGRHPPVGGQRAAEPVEQLADPTAAGRSHHPDVVVGQGGEGGGQQAAEVVVVHGALGHVHHRPSVRQVVPPGRQRLSQGLLGRQRAENPNEAGSSRRGYSNSRGASCQQVSKYRVWSSSPPHPPGRRRARGRRPWPAGGPQRTGAQHLVHMSVAEPHQRRPGRSHRAAERRGVHAGQGERGGRDAEDRRPLGPRHSEQGGQHAEEAGSLRTAS